LVHALDRNIQYQLDRNRKGIFEAAVVHIDSTLSASSPSGPLPAEELLSKYRAQFPRISFQRIPLETALDLKTINWSSLPKIDTNLPARERLSKLFNDLPSTTSRADLLRLLIRHILVSFAMNNSFHALFLAHTTTGLAELTLTEAAKGRGLAIPVNVNDGQFPVTIFGSSHTQKSAGEEALAPTNVTFPVYYLLRDVFRSEITTYHTLIQPSIVELVVKDESKRSTVVSHKDLSIEDIMSRYFESVEKEYPSVVANVVRTTGKLARVQSSHSCDLCGMALDEAGNARWNGEIGITAEDGHEEQARQLCYGCERSIYG
jgi:cytoplasmic tRNA 2-thiolation protein 2